MDVSMLGQCFASAVRYIQDCSSIEAPPYFDEIPENFVVPSIYFPVPRVICRKATLSSFRSIFIMNCWFMAVNEWEAYQNAMDVWNCLLSDRCIIPAVKKDGTKDGWSIRASEPEIRKMDDSTIQLSFDLKEYFSYLADETKAGDVIFGGIVKSGMLKQAWIEATTEQRIEEEAQKECLRKIMKNL